MRLLIKLEHRDPRTLRPHPANAEIYDVCIREDEELLESVKELGVLQPIDILKNGLIVGGHRRVRAAIKAGIDSVPCAVRGDVNPKDDLAVLKLLITLNNYGPKKVADELTPES